MIRCNLKLAPYQIFFPIGFLNALIAVGVWFIQDFHWFSAPTMLIHEKLIMGGFLWSFIVGFLMTAIPKMTGTNPANKVELTFASILIAGLMYFSWDIDPRFFYANHMILILFLIFFGGRRFLKTTKPAPVFFSHVVIGLFLALAGAIYHFQGNSIMGIHLFHVGAVLLLVLGIGTRFFSFLSGLPSAFEGEKSVWFRRGFHVLGIIMALLLFCAGSGVVVAYLGLTIGSLIYLFAIWKVHRASERASPLKYGLKFVALMIPLSFLMSYMQPQMFITWFHLLFIGCFGLITFSVATRVTLAHGSYSTNLEIKSPALAWFVFFLILGLSSRILYGFAEGSWKKSLLHLAATFWLLALGSWGSSFLFKIFKPGSQPKASC